MKPLSPAWLRRLSSAAVLLVVVVGVGAFALLARPEHAPRTAGPGVDPLPVNVQPAAWADSFTVTRYFVGRVEARQASDLGFEVPGMVAQIKADEGQLLPAGTVIARLDTKRTQARRAELQAATDQAQADHDLAQITLDRVRRARERSAATAQELDESQQAARAAEAALRRAQAAVAAVEVDLAKAELIAPFDAVVAARYTDTGQVVAAGQSVVRLLERDRPEVRVSVGGRAVKAVAEGQAYDVQIGDRVVRGTVRAILPTRDQVTRGVDVVIVLDAQIDGIRSGDLARVAIDQKVETRGFWVPSAALTEGVRGLWSIYTLGDASDASAGAAVVRRTDVELLHTEADRVYVRGGLAEGERFIADGLHRIAPGMAVTPQPLNADTPAGGAS